jgi:quercetin dioxygenase-like cupin family protein
MANMVTEQNLSEKMMETAVPGVRISLRAGYEAQPKREVSAEMRARFGRFRSLLQFTACRILGGPERAEIAVQNCWRTASRNPLAFRNDGDFRGWLLRLLIDEALAILHEPELPERAAPTAVRASGETRPVGKTKRRNEMSTLPNHTISKPLAMPNGTLFEILTSPKEIGDEVCLIRVTLPPGGFAPLHSHEDFELFYIVEGSMEIFQSKEGEGGWVTAGVGAAVAIPGNVKHALRNSSSVSVTIALVTTSKLCAFFGEVSKPFDAKRPAVPPAAEERKAFFETVARYGYWMGSPAENAAIGIML